MSGSNKLNLEELKKTLTPTQFEVMCNEGTEPAFKNEYWDNKRQGLYVDRISGKALFVSMDKYDSGTGWPSFTRPIDGAAVTTKVDHAYGMVRTEVRSASSDAHLGHLFEDGPAPLGQRYCMNSAALHFIPVEELETRGYGEYQGLFKSEDAKGKTEALGEAMFGAGCFWGVEDIIRKIPGVIETEVGYAGGKTKNPNYDVVKTGETGHAEVVYVKFDPKKVSYDEIMSYFFRLHDPTTENRQGNDIGTQYRSIIFTKDESQRLAAQKAIAATEASERFKHRKVVTEIVPWTTFYLGEDFHQDYLVKRPDGYTCHWLRD